MTTEQKITIREVLETIAAEHGGNLTPEMVVEFARPKDSPLHKHFEWNNQKAAAEFRLAQAGMLIRRVKVTYEPTEGREIRVRAFHNVRPSKDDSSRERGSYVTLESALSIPDYKAQIIAAAKRDANAFRSKYSALQEVEKVIGAIDEIFPNP